MPEDDEFSEEIRQMVVGRYRVLFTIKGRKVHVLHVRGHMWERLISLKMITNGHLTIILASYTLADLISF